MNALSPISTDARPIAALPHNLEAEQALLGALLYDNAAFERLSRPAAAAATSTSRSTSACSTPSRTTSARASWPSRLLMEQFKPRPGVRGAGRPALPGRPGRPRPAGRQRPGLRPAGLRPGPAPRPDPHRRRHRQGAPRTPRPPASTRSNRPSSSSTTWPRRAAVVGLRQLRRRPAGRRGDGRRGPQRDGGLAGPVHRLSTTWTRSSAACTRPTC